MFPAGGCSGGCWFSLWLLAFWWLFWLVVWWLLWWLLWWLFPLYGQSQTACGLVPTGHGHALPVLGDDAAQCIIVLP